MSVTYRATSVSAGCRIHESLLSQVGMPDSSCPLRSSTYQFGPRSPQQALPLASGVSRSGPHSHPDLRTYWPFISMSVLSEDDMSIHE